MVVAAIALAFLVGVLVGAVVQWLIDLEEFARR